MVMIVKKTVAQHDAEAVAKEIGSSKPVVRVYDYAGTKDVTADDFTNAVNVEIATITKAPEFQVRQKTDQAMVKRYAEVIRAGKVMPPVRLARIKLSDKAEPMLTLVDGFHRLAAHERLGLVVIQATVEDMGPEVAKWKAAEANMSHGLPLSNKEVREAFKRFIRAKQHVLGKDRRGKVRLMSYREMSQHIGKQHTTIRNWMMQDFPEVYAQIGDKVEDVDWSAKGKPVADVSEGQANVDDPVTHLEAALKAYQATANSKLRGEAVYRVKQIAEQMEKAGGWDDMSPDF